MLALCKERKGPGQINLLDLETPEPRPGEVQIAIQAAGICGTDIHIRHDTFPYVPPVILGHEFSGRISAVGAGVEGLSAGDRVMAETTAVVCGVCPYCQAGQTNNCPKRRAYGIHVNGGFAQYICVRQEAVHALPPSVDFVAGAMTEPLAVCVHALIERGRISAGQVVLILGPGPIGLLAAMVAAAQGATVIVAGISRDAARLELADRLGVAATVKVDEVDLQEVLQTWCAAQGGVDLTVEASGAPPSVATAFQCTRKGGTVVQLGLFEGPITVDYSQIAFRELAIIGSFAHTWTSFDKALDLMERKIIDIAPLVSGVITLEGWEDAFDRAERGDGVKILLTPPGAVVAHA